MSESRCSRRLTCWESVFERGKIEGDCPVCQCSKIRYKSTQGNTFQALHIIPLSKGGKTESWNLLPGCGCNQNMSSMNLLDWMGTRGNKQSLMRPLFLRKYKSLVPPIYRSTTDNGQLKEWIERQYNPLFLEEYGDWLILLEKDLKEILLDSYESTNNFAPQQIDSVEVVISTHFTRNTANKMKWSGTSPRY